MFGSSQRTKLLQLREKTDQELIRLVANRLQSGMLLARQIGDGDGETLSARAERAFADAAVLVGVISPSAQAERIQLESQLADLRGLLDQHRAQIAA